jgi:hypothetical protein
MHNPQANTSTFKNDKLPRQFFIGLSELFLELGIDGHQFVQDFTRHHLQTAAQSSTRLTDIYNRTGFSEYTSKKFLNNSDTKYYPKRKQYYRSLINEIKELCQKSKDDSIPIYGKHHSYVAAFNYANATDNSITAPSVLQKLIKAGIVEKLKNKRIRFITSLPTTGLNNTDDITKLLAVMINRISSTLLHNLITDNSEDTLFQMTYYSNAIHPDNRKTLTDRLREEQRKDFLKYQKIIDAYEEQGLQRKQVESLDQEVGVTSLIFNNQTRSKT